LETSLSDSGEEKEFLPMILAYPELDWYWVAISMNQNVTLETILAHPEYPWSWRAVSWNKMDEEIKDWRLYLRFEHSNLPRRFQLKIIN